MKKLSCLKMFRSFSQYFQKFLYAHFETFFKGKKKDLPVCACTDLSCLAVGESCSEQYSLMEMSKIERNWINQFHGEWIFPTKRWGTLFLVIFIFKDTGLLSLHSVLSFVSLLWKSGPYVSFLLSRIGKLIKPSSKACFAHCGGCGNP